MTRVLKCKLRGDKNITDKFDVLRGRLLGNHNDFHWQLGGQINHQPCRYKAARVIRCTELEHQKQKKLKRSLCSGQRNANLLLLRNIHGPHIRQPYYRQCLFESVNYIFAACVNLTVLCRFLLHSKDDLSGIGRSHQRSFCDRTASAQCCSVYR